MDFPLSLHNPNIPYQVFALGDTHGLGKLFSRISADLGHLNNFIIVHVGDAGDGFSKVWDKRYLAEISLWLQQHCAYLYVIRGNHSNPAYYHLNHWSNSGDRVRFVPDYSYIKINQKKCFFLGGAISIDRITLHEGHNWWPDEVIERRELNTLQRADVAFFHTAPANFYPYTYGLNVLDRAAVDLELKSDLLSERQYLNDVLYQVRPSRVWLGHFHETYSGIYHAPYDEFYTIYRLLQINELIDISGSFPLDKTRNLS